MNAPLVVLNLRAVLNTLYFALLALECGRRFRLPPVHGEPVVAGLEEERG